MHARYQLCILCLCACMAACGTAPPAGSSATPPAVSELAIKSFTVNPNPVERGATLTVSWDVPGAARTTLLAMRGPTGSHGDLWWSPASEEFGLPLTFSSATGHTTVLVPGNMSHQVFRFDLEAIDALGMKVTANSEDIRLKCAPPLTGQDQTLCPFPAQVVRASYQPFEHGYLIWRGDTQEIFVLLANEAYASGWSLHPTIDLRPTLTLAPPELYEPSERFAGLWASDWGKTPTALSEILGWATEPEQAYDMTMQFTWGNGGSVPSAVLLLSFPDQHVVSLIALDGANSTSGPAWYQ